MRMTALGKLSCLMRYPLNMHGDKCCDGRAINLCCQVHYPPVTVPSFNW